MIWALTFCVCINAIMELHVLTLCLAFPSLPRWLQAELQALFFDPLLVLSKRIVKVTIDTNTYVYKPAMTIWNVLLSQDHIDPIAIFSLLCGRNLCCLVPIKNVVLSPGQTLILIASCCVQLTLPFFLHEHVVMVWKFYCPRSAIVLNQPDMYFSNHSLTKKYVLLSCMICKKKHVRRIST